ncbi:MAG TPA: sugar ABC transporter substrate-binding protein [Clostridiaceae bacterium]|nr:sugar ABC transporter substrate-binding protein [Clostridiaceae bacterium]
MEKAFRLISVFLLAICLLTGMVACSNSKNVGISEVNTGQQDDAGKEQISDKETGEDKATEEDAVQESNKSDEDKRIVIGMVPTSIANNPLYMFLVDGCQKIADEEGVTLITTDVKMDASLQISALENLIAQKVDTIIVDPVDAQAISSKIKEAMDKGIKIVSLSGKTDAYDSYLTIDHKKVGYVEGQMAAKWINEKLGGKAEVGILNYRLGSVLINREDGMREALEAECPGAQIVAVGQADNPTDGMKVTENFLQAHPNIKVILCVNDAGALGAVEAVKASGKASDDFAVFGADSAPEALAKIKEGSVLRGTVYIYPEELPGIIMDTSIKLSKGETVDKEIVGRVGAVTQENFDEIIKQ